MGLNAPPGSRGPGPGPGLGSQIAGPASSSLTTAALEVFRGFLSLAPILPSGTHLAQSSNSPTTYQPNQFIVSPSKMTRQSLSRATGLISRGLRTSSPTTSANTSAALTAPRQALRTPARAALVRGTVTVRPRFLSTTSSQRKGILPDSDNPTPPNVLDHASPAAPAQLTDGEYHEVADEYLEIVLAHLERIADQTETVEVEYSVRALTFAHAPTI